MKNLSIITFLLILSGCSASQKIGTTLPGETDHQAIGTGYTEDDALKMASYTAEQYCLQQTKRHAIKSVNSEYRGTVTAKTRDTLDTIGTIASATGNWIPTPGSDTDYKTTAIFKCM